jgi:hypothetical protein
MYLILPIHTADNGIVFDVDVFQLQLTPTVISDLVNAVTLFQSLERERLLSMEFDFPESKKAWQTGLEGDLPDCPFSVAGIEGLTTDGLQLEIFTLVVGNDGRVTFHCCEHGSADECFTDAITVDCPDPRSVAIECAGWSYLPRKCTVSKNDGQR